VTTPAPVASAPPDPEARRTIGRSARRDVPLESHAEVPTGDRPDPVDVLHAQGTTRVPVDGGVAFDQGIVEFAERYADLNESDYAVLKEAAGAARITVHSGV
jgi:hypothetical protein